MSVCTRFRRDGVRCTNQTEYVDGWCRADECDGFLRAEQSGAPESVGVPHGTAKHIRMSRDLPVGDISVEDVHDVRVTVRATDSFRYHHGGDERAAEFQLRNMLEDFLLKSARRPSSGGYLRLSRNGFDVVLSPDRGTITGYSTIHRERTWEQVKSGVKSRFSGRSHGGPGVPRPDIGPPVLAEDFANTFDPASVHLTVRVRQAFARIHALTSDVDTTIRQSLAQWDPRTLVSIDEGLFEIQADNNFWLVSPDCRVLIGVRDHPFST
ncbi:MAG: hypothetical protein EOP31_09820 [Rhodococcus sp. (in: high G+C Gram-positive bacteria)]|uniref:hypothetical protein n=1 Tax=Rhodococcus sp. TaxID=1831 RepID=UPI00121E18A8|nr:hypothetical protein [Rhodococcus sp. (in: high G+C Gram-positive bacteria)]RZL25398.1 MAG: hypothetical protein EOP31_09820 [Rhodococcus sp. (in: high G+C Gram-positive bacteria)]